MYTYIDIAHYAFNRLYAVIHGVKKGIVVWHCTVRFLDRFLCVGWYVYLALIEGYGLALDRDTNNNS